MGCKSVELMLAPAVGNACDGVDRGGGGKVLGGDGVKDEGDNDSGGVGKGGCEGEIKIEFVGHCEPSVLCIAPTNPFGM